jgi:SPP1 gp7 family putative phage head morphogenesis protein
MDRKILVQPLTEAIEDYANIVIANTADAVERGMRRTVDQLNKLKFGEKSIKAKLDYGFIRDFSIAIFDKIKKYIFEASENTMNRLIGNVMDNLSQSYKEGYGYNKAAERLEDVFTNMETYELERIARTEIAGQENLGMHEGNKELGVEYEKWRTARDADVRDSHQDLEGQIVKVGDRFSNGLEYPGDRSGPIEEWINCRCTLMPFLMPEGYTAPSGMTFFYESDLVKAK